MIVRLNATLPNNTMNRIGKLFMGEHWHASRGGNSRYMSWIATLKVRAKSLKRQTLVVYFAARDPRTPVIVRLLAVAVAAYALSPIDLIPDFIPVLGYLDDLILIPIGLALVVWLVPADVMQAAHARAEAAVDRPPSYPAAALIVVVWVVVLTVVCRWAYRAAYL
jgi:uncharacterized membrane protein YkvA (DUF1232 family)